VVSHLVMVATNPELREAHAQAQPLIDAHFSAVGQDKALYQALKAIDPQALPQDQRRALTLALQDFEMSGVALEGQARAGFRRQPDRDGPPFDRIFQCRAGRDRGVDAGNHR
jgi:oligopeptidase A